MQSKALFSSILNNTHTGIQTEACSKRLAISHNVKNEYVMFESHTGIVKGKYKALVGDSVLRNVVLYTTKVADWITIQGT